MQPAQAAAVLAVGLFGLSPDLRADAYLFTSFRGNGEDGLHLALSTYANTDGTGDDGYNHRIYCTTTADFKTFSPSRLFYDPGFNCIDAALLSAAGRFYLIFKDERKNPLQKRLRYAVAEHPDGPFGPSSDPFTGDWVEGPSVIQIDGQFIVYFDHYAQPHFYGAVRSADLKSRTDCSTAMHFPPGQRHGTVLRVSAPVAARLQLQR